MSNNNLSIAIEKSKEGFAINANLGGSKPFTATIKDGGDMLRVMSNLAIYLLDGGVPAERIPEIQKEIVDGIKNGYSEGSGVGIAVGNGSTGVCAHGHSEDGEFQSSVIVDVEEIPKILKEVEAWLRKNVESDLGVRSMMARTESGLKEAIEHFWERVKNGDFKKPEPVEPTGDLAFLGVAEGKAMLERRLRDLVGDDVFEKFKADADRMFAGHDAGVDWAAEKACIVKDVKSLRKQFDEVLQNLKSFRSNVSGSSFIMGDLDGVVGFKDPDEVEVNMELAIRHAEDCIMRLGMTLKNIGGEPSPYPNSYNPNNAIVEPTADNLKL